MMNDESSPKTLYVGNLDHTVSEDLLCALFSQMGAVKGCKIIREIGNDPYAFIEFANHHAATTALSAMNKRLFLDKEIKVNWATSPGNQPKTDTSAHHHIFVGDLSPEIETETLREAFAPFGEISNCRIVRDPQTLKSKGYAFVSFVKKAEAENAIQAMNGQWLGSRSIRTNWSTRKPPAPRETSKNMMKGGKTTYEDISKQTGPTNTTVYCGGFPPNVISDDLVHKHFGQFGAIQDVRVFKEKGYAFIKFMTKAAATQAIENTNNGNIHGHVVRSFWGKENGGEMLGGGGNGGVGGGVGGGGLSTALGGGVVALSTGVGGQAVTAGPGGVANQAVQQQGAGPYPQQYSSYQQMGYWYQPVASQGYPTQMQAQYMQQGFYPYTYTSPQQGGAYRMVQQNVAWGVPAVPNVAAAAAAAAATNGAATQPQMMYAATMHQYQTQ